MAQELRERKSSGHQGWHALPEIIEVVVLAVVAVATAFSGFQATEWDGRQSSLDGQATSLRFEANAQSTFGGQRLAADAGFFTAWLQAHVATNVAPS